MKLSFTGLGSKAGWIKIEHEGQQVARSLSRGRHLQPTLKTWVPLLGFGGKRKLTPQSCSVIIHMCTAYITTHTCHTHIMYSNNKIPSWYVDRITILLRHALIHRLSRLTLNSVGNWEWCWAELLILLYPPEELQACTTTPPFYVAWIGPSSVCMLGETPSLRYLF